MAVALGELLLSCGLTRQFGCSHVHVVFPPVHKANRRRENATLWPECIKTDWHEFTVTLCLKKHRSKSNSVFVHKRILNSRMTNDNMTREVKATDLWSVRMFGCLSFGTGLFEIFLQAYSKNMQLYNWMCLLNKVVECGEHVALL